MEKSKDNELNEDLHSIESSSSGLERFWTSQGDSVLVVQRKVKMGKESDAAKKLRHKYQDYDDSWGTYVWNSQTKQFLGKTGTSWAKLVIFYIFFYAGLASFSLLCYYLFAHTLIEDQPKWILDKSLIGENPGMGYRPMPDSDMNQQSTLIWYKRESESDAEYWHDQLKNYINSIENQENSIPCDYRNKNEASKEKYCRVDHDKFGNCQISNGFGYPIGEPCILLKLNRIYGWKPQGFGLMDGKYNAETLKNDLKDQKQNNKMPKPLIDYINKRVSEEPNKERLLSTIWISCDGEGIGDQENLRLNNSNETILHYYPQQGIPGFYFPYLNQKGYQSPFIFVQFPSPRNSVLINIECKAWAKNIKHDKMNRLGSVHFELMIDSN